MNACVPYPEGTLAVAGETVTLMGSATPLADLNAARPAPQLSAPERVAPAETVPAVFCRASSAIILVFGAAGMDSSMV